MYKVKNAVIALLLLSFGACSNIRPKLVNAFSKYNFDYSITNQRKNNIIQIFDDGNSTYIQFFPQILTKDSFTGLTEERKKLSFICIDKRLCKADKIFVSLTISDLNANTKIIRLVPVSPQIPTGRGADGN